MKKFGLETTKYMRTPIGTNVKLTKDENGSSVHPTLSRSMIVNPLYLSDSRRPDIFYSVGVRARYQENPKESYLPAMKRIICYVKRY